MSELKQKLLGASGKEIGTLDLDPEVFGVRVNSAIVHQTVRWQLTKRRAGTHATLTKGMMKGGNRKPWRQKGTGQARAGSNTSPIWVGGGVAHGPQPRSYEHRLSKEFRRQALASVLSDKLSEGQLILVDELKVNGKVSEGVAALRALGISSGLQKKGVTVVLSEKEISSDDGKIVRSLRNIEGLITLPVVGVNAYDLIRNRTLVGTKEAIVALQVRVKGDKKAKKTQIKKAA